MCVCALVALFAFGCGGSDDSDTSGTTTASSNEPITLELWDVGVPDPKVTKQIDDAYMAEHPNITIKRVHQPAAAYYPPGPLLRATIAKGKGPDMMLSFASPFAFDYVQGIQPLNDLITDDDLNDLVGWDATTRSNGEKLVFPFDANGVIFYYDKAKFEQAGLDPEAPPQTWDDLLTACDKLSAAGITPITAGWKDGGYLFWWLTLFGTQFQSDDELAKGASDPDWGTPAIQKTVDLVREANDHKCFTPNAEAINLFPDTVNNFKAGKGAMFVGLIAADAHWSQFRETKWGKGLGTFLAPLVPDSLWDAPRINYGVSTGYWVTKWSEHPQEAVDFLRYMASPPVQEMIYAEAGAAPANRNAKLDITDPVGVQIADWAANADPYMDQFTLVGANVLSLLAKYAPEMIKEKIDYDEVADQLIAAQEKSPK